MKSLATAAVCAAGLLVATPVIAAEQPIGEPIEKNGMEIAAVYLQPIMMEPQEAHAGHGAAQPDVHIEADIKGLKGNNNGFGEGEWIPYLAVSYSIEKIGGTFKDSGKLVPMVASDGPHYGLNVKLDGPGKYKLTYTIQPPSVNGFYRHTDKETGVGKWWEPFSNTWEFAYVGSAGKKGGY